MNVNYNKCNSVAFVAPDYAIEDGTEQADYQGRLIARIEELYRLGYRNFFTAVEQGFDLLAAEALLIFRDREGVTDTNLLCYITNESQADDYTSYYRNLFGDIFAQSDFQESVAPAHHNAAWPREAKRAHFLQSCSAVLTTDDHQSDQNLQIFLSQAAMQGMKIFEIGVLG